MIKLKSETWYYFYTDGKEFCVSEDAPIKSSQGSKDWHHPSAPFVLVGPPLRAMYVGNPESSKNIQDFISYD